MPSAFSRMRCGTPGDGRFPATDRPRAIEDWQEARRALHKSACRCARRPEAMDLQLSDKTALVTGASMGIGRAIAKGLALEGVRVAAVARGAELLQGSGDQAGAD